MATEILHRPDYRDLVIADAFDAIAHLEQSVVTYRDLFIRALAHGYDLNTEIGQQRRTIERLRGELSRLRTPSQVAA